MKKDHTLKTHSSPFNYCS